MNARLAIMDWGIGGLGVYSLVKDRMPGVRMVYFSDTGAVPYGKMTRRELTARLDAVIAFLRSKGVTHVVVACNAASTGIPFLDKSGVKIEGVIDAAVAVAARAKPKKLGLIGGRRTVVSGVYRKAFAERGIEVRQRVAQPLSGLIESGDLSSEKLHGECQRILSPIRNSSHILLACTHYPAIEPVLKKFVDESTKFIDPAEELVRRVERWKLADGGGEDSFYTTGDSAMMKRSARSAFDVRIEKVAKVRV